MVAMTQRKKIPTLPCRLTLAVYGACWLLCGTVAAQSLRLPDRPAQVMLIRNTIAAVNHGTITGNYTVLRDLGSDRFRQKNTSGDLAATFAAFKKQQLDLSPTLVIDPQLTQPVGTDENGRLHLVGFFPTRPQSVTFQLTFQPVGGSWTIHEVSLGVTPFESLAQYSSPQNEPPRVRQASYAAPAAGSVAPASRRQAGPPRPRIDAVQGPFDGPARRVAPR